MCAKVQTVGFDPIGLKNDMGSSDSVCGKNDISWVVVDEDECDRSKVGTKRKKEIGEETTRGNKHAR